MRRACPVVERTGLGIAQCICEGAQAGKAMESETEVLIVGAGPTGLALALWLGHFGV